MAMADENTNVQPPVGQTGNQKQSGDQQGAVPPFQFDTMMMDQQTQPIQQGTTQSAQEQNSASQSSDGSPMTLDSMQQGFQDVGQELAAEPAMPSLDAVPEMPADTNEQQPVQQEVASTEAPTVADVPQMPEMPSLDLGNLDSPVQPASTSEPWVMNNEQEAAQSEAAALPEMPAIDIPSLDAIPEIETVEMPSLDLPTVETTPEASSEMPVVEKPSTEQEVPVTETVEMSSLDLPTESTAEVQNNANEEMKQEVKGDTTTPDETQSEIVEMPPLEPVTDTPSQENNDAKMPAVEETSVDANEQWVVNEEESGQSDTTSEVPAVVPMVETNNEDKSQVEDVPSEAKAEEVVDRVDSPSEEEDNIEVEEELDSEGSLTVQFMATHELVKQLFTVSRKAQEEQLEVIGMQSDAMTVKYMFGLPMDANAIEIEKITEIVDQEPTSTKLTLKYYEQSMQLDVLLNDTIVLQERNYSTDEEDVKHYVSDKLNKFTALLESNIKKIKKERRREKEERKERKKLVSQLRDF